MFFLSGFAMVTAGTFVVVYNADIILPAVAAVGSRYGRIVPAIKTGIAYPLTARFRTGMTMAMIGLIMFALVMNATLNSNFQKIFLNKDSLGGWDVQATVNSNNRVSDVATALGNAGVNPADVRAAGETRIAFPFEAEVENRDHRKNQDGELKEFSRYLVIGADDGFISNNTIPMKYRASGYGSDRDVWNALAGGKALAILPAAVTVQQGNFGPPQDQDMLSLKPLQPGFEPFPLTFRDPAGNLTTVTVIGQMKNSADGFWRGIVVSRATLDKAFPDSKGQVIYFALQPGVNSDQFAKRLEAGLVQASVDSLQKILDDQQAASRGFFLVLQGFMGLGLIIGIAALSVVASRAVVERRQQIGMLRAIGYQRSMVALSFLFESSFVALSGILLGIGLGLSLAWVLFTSGSIGPETKNVGFVVPWLELGGVGGLAFAAASLMTFLPARAASRVPVAEALRYE
jgi:putative ABC transport system permease protein